MQNRSTLNRFALPAVLITVIGCAGLGKSPMRYLGNSTEVADLETPDGFKVSPSELRDIIFARDGAKIFIDDYYADENNYYVRNGFPFRGSRSSAKKHGRMINGQTGEIYNQTTETWEPDPREQTNTPLATGH
ncbi:hypothetical protein CA54_24720 [Symmachiella macrocystis]|uniref:Uncharacterized protein n=1 Tax=Symmachiella macrocystis TaxID=2527985 RepID=A0A5C6BPJ4_9PLAN|nr:hypothetical protein [Symmachiella macrocystis]TWU13637.1 hypothetical protein CA54_24720 [Symmachiella macrocystis]